MLPKAMPLRSGLAAASIALVAAVLAAACDDDDTAGDRPTVVATTTQVADLARNVAGERADVRQLLQPNSDPHGYEPRPSDARAVNDAAVVLRSGGEVDGWLDDLVKSAGGDAAKVTLSDHVRTRGDDPHWWQDPRNAQLAVAAIREALAKADPEGARAYAGNAGAYLKRLRALDRAAARCIGLLPQAQRRLVTSHDALDYYAARYGLEVLGSIVPSLSSEAQPSAGDTTELIERLKRERVKAIFPESSLNPKLERAVANWAGVKLGRALWADTLGPEGSGGATYIASIAANTQALVDGLSGGKRRCRPQG
jgi:zinc/manganese transport system substrate-binding protein